MRVGSFMRLVREGDSLSLRAFAKAIGVPHSTLSAMENGWISPTEMVIHKLARHAVSERLYAKARNFFLAQYFREHALRVCGEAGVTVLPLCLLAASALRVVLSSAPEDFLYQDLEKEKKHNFSSQLYSDLLRILLDIQAERPEDFLKAVTPATVFPFELRLKLTYWLLQVGEKSFIKEKDAYRYPLTEPIRKWAEKAFSALPLTRRRGFRYLYDVYQLLNVDVPEYVPDPFTSLDLLLLLPSKIDLDFLCAGKAVMTIPLNKGEAEVEVYSPPLLYEFPDLDFGGAYTRVTNRSS